MFEFIIDLELFIAIIYSFGSCVNKILGATQTN